MEFSVTLGEVLNCGMLVVLVLMYKRKVDDHDVKLQDHGERIVKCETEIENLKGV